jgi:ribosome-binding factor A
VSQRTSRVDELLREEISQIISRDVADPRIGFVTITDVEVTSDLRHATVWVSVIGDEQTRRESLRALGRAMPFVRSQLGKLRIKRIPDLHLRHDDSAERGTRLLQILGELESGGTPDVPVVGETLPMPLGGGSSEAADERAEAISAARTERAERRARALERGERPKQWPSEKAPRRGR